MHGAKCLHLIMVLEGRGPLLNGLQLQALVPICTVMFITVIIYCDKHKKKIAQIKFDFLKKQRSKDLKVKRTLKRLERTYSSHSFVVTFTGEVKGNSIKFLKYACGCISDSSRKQNCKSSLDKILHKIKRTI